MFRKEKERKKEKNARNPAVRKPSLKFLVSRYMAPRAGGEASLFYRVPLAGGLGPVFCGLVSLLARITSSAVSVFTVKALCCSGFVSSSIVSHLGLLPVAVVSCLGLIVRVRRKKCNVSVV